MTAILIIRNSSVIYAFDPDSFGLQPGDLIVGMDAEED